MNKQQQHIVSKIMADHVEAEIVKRIRAEVPHTPEEARRRADEVKALKSFLRELNTTFQSEKRSAENAFEQADRFDCSRQFRPF